MYIHSEQDLPPDVYKLTLADNTGYMYIYITSTSWSRSYYKMCYCIRIHDYLYLSIYSVLQSKYLNRLYINLPS